MTILMKSLQDVKKVFGLKTKVLLIILLALTICSCSGPKLMLGQQTIGNQTDYSLYSGKLAKQMYVVTECAILRTDGQGFLSWPQAKRLIKLQYPQTPDSEFYQSLAQMRKRCLLIKWYPSRLIIPSSSNQSRTVWTGRRRNSPIGSQPRNLPVKNSTKVLLPKRGRVSIPRSTGKTPGDNSYDGEKLKLLIHDESGKWERPTNILNNWRVTKTCLRLGSKIVGKCMMGSTSNALDKGGANFKKLYYASDVRERNRNGQTSSGLYSLFIPMEWNYEGFIDAYGVPVFDTPSEKTL